MSKDDAGVAGPGSSPSVEPQAGLDASHSIPIAKRLFDATSAECELEDELTDADVPFDRLGWDHCDCSLEIHGLPPEYRLSEAAQRVVYDAGFAIAFCNHADKWETHYRFRLREPFRLSEGWRVSYPHKRGDDDGKILVEKRVPTWPAEWFETGYVLIQNARGIEARSAETQGGSVHESPKAPPLGDAPKSSMEIKAQEGRA